MTPGFATALLAGACLLLASTRLPDAGRVPAAAPAWAAALALVAVAALGAAQSLSWPLALVEAVSSEHARFARESAALAALSEPARAPLSLAPAASRAAALAWLLPAVGFLLGRRLGAGRRARRLLGAAIVGAGLFQLAYGVPLWLARSSAIWGVETPLAALRLRGTFVNPNHLALFLEIALGPALAWVWWAARRAREEPRAERRLLRLAPPALVASALVAALAATGSRAGLLAIAVGVGAAAAIAARGRARATLAGVGLAVALVLGVGALGGFSGAFERWSATTAADASGQARLAAAAGALELARGFPLTGVGLGAFQAAFPLVQPGGLEGVWRHAHDDWAELAATTGISGCLLVALGLAALVAALARAARAARRSEDRAAVLAATAALVAAAVHEAFDFGLTMPANAFALAVVAGAATIVGTRSGEGSGGAEAEADPSPRADQPPEAVQLAAEPSSKPSAKTSA